MFERDTMACSAFDGRLPLDGRHEGVEITDRDGAGLASLVVRRGARQGLRAALAAHDSLDLREGAVVSQGHSLVLVGTGADSWLAVSSAPHPSLYSELALGLAGHASICDQSDGYGLVRLSGRNARPLLQRLLPIDLDPGVFAVGAAASTLAAHIPLLIWRAGEADYELAVFRSYAGSFTHALKAAARPFKRTATPIGRG